MIPPEWSTELFLEFDDDPDEEFVDHFDVLVFDQMKDLGYETHNALRLLGSLFVFAVLYYLRVLIFYPIVALISKFYKPA